MRLERTKNAIRNAGYNFLSNIVSIILPFLVRTVFIKVLGAEFLGLNSLFSSILMVLNLTELGFSSAIVYHMYKPIAQDDTKTINALLQYYKAVYRKIGLIIFCAGCCLIPFLPYLIEGAVPPNINITVIYLAYLVNTSASYFLYAYYSSLISAFQREDLISKNNMLIQSAMYGIQILCLISVKNYYAYIAIMPVFTILNNIRIRIVARKVFPDYHPEGSIGEALKRDIRKKVSGLMISKVCGVSRNSFDSIFLSALLGLVNTARYNNYYYIMSSISNVMRVVNAAATAGVGNSVAMDSVEDNYRNMERMNFLYMWLGGWFTSCLLCLYQPFMKLWVGTEMMFPMHTVVLICLYFYVLKIGDIRSMYIASKGVWWELRFCSILEAVANITLNYVLGKYFGVNGIILATVISLFFINFLYGSQVIFNQYFGKEKIKKYYLNHFMYGLTTILAAAITYSLCACIPLEGFAGLFVKAGLCAVVPNLVFWIIYRKSSNYELTIPWVLDKLRINRNSN